MVCTFLTVQCELTRRVRDAREVVVASRYRTRRPRRSVVSAGLLLSFLVATVLAGCAQSGGITDATSCEDYSDAEIAQRHAYLKSRGVIPSEAPAIDATCRWSNVNHPIDGDGTVGYVVDLWCSKHYCGDQAIPEWEAREPGGNRDSFDPSVNDAPADSDADTPSDENEPPPYGTAQPSYAPRVKECGALHGELVQAFDMTCASARRVAVAAGGAPGCRPQPGQEDRRCRVGRWTCRLSRNVDPTNPWSAGCSTSRTFADRAPQVDFYVPPPRQ